MARLRFMLAGVALLVLSACSKPGINAGVRGGIAFIAFTVFLLLTIAILWFFLGREE